MKGISALLFFLLSFTVMGQHHNGFIYSDYSGVISSRLNPAVIANSPYKYDFNVANGNFYITNNIGYWGENIEGTTGLIRNIDGKERFINSDVRFGGLSVMLSLKNRSSIALQYQLRTVASGINISPEFIEQLGRIRTVKFAGSEVIGQSGDLAMSSWHQASLTYAGLLVDNGYFRLKVGATLKMMNPIANAVTRIESISYTSDNLGLVELTELQGQIGYSSNLNDFKQFDGNQSFAFPAALGFKPSGDIGFVYETVLYRDDPQTKKGTSYSADILYEHRLGVSITDIGKMTFDYGSASFDVNGVIPQQNPIDFDTLLSGIASVRELRDSLSTVTNVSDLLGSYTVSLPTALNINYDYNMRNDWFLNISGQFDISTLMNADYRINYPNSITVTPRYDTGILGTYFPLYLNMEGDMELGFGVRYGPITIGTHSLGSLLSAKPSSMGAYFSININKLKANSAKPYCFGKTRTGTAGTRQLRKPLYKRKKFLFW